MSRSERLFDLMQVLRRHRGTVAGAVLAREVGISIRTLRRDIVTLQSMGADIDGEPGVGYILRPGFLLPPLSFTAEEIQALVAGAQWVSRQTDDGLAHAVQNALAKIDAVLPPDMRRALNDNTLYISRQPDNPAGLDLARVRAAIREQRKMRVLYTGEDGNASERVIWPIILGFIDAQRFIAAWCESLGDFHMFHAARVVKAEFLDEPYEASRRQLVKEWHTRAKLHCNRSDCA
ncbi:YafY family transcriptional regulator [Oxalobacteraceae bacterium OTU3CINTB1]|nr:YafY family transcriptional regulator [Oxalobacteraceae bacterium OTU3CINTB1]